MFAPCDGNESDAQHNSGASFSQAFDSANQMDHEFREKEAAANHALETRGAIVEKARRFIKKVIVSGDDIIIQCRNPVRRGLSAYMDICILI
jgi:hypothetical protein